jgi:hypothetical protein
VIRLKRTLCEITIVPGVVSLFFSQALAASSGSGDLSAAEQAELQRSAGITCDAGKSDNCTAGYVESGGIISVFSRRQPYGQSKTTQRHCVR